MPYFKQFPKVEYDFERNGIVQNMVDIFRHVKPLQNFVDNFSGYRFYNIINGERPDIVSTRLYGNQDFYWTFFVINEYLHDGYRSWPVSQEALLKFMEVEYNGFAIETNPSTIDRTSDGLIESPVNSHRNSLAGRFQIGETITGGTTGATGTLTRKITDLSQVIVQNTTGIFQAPELIIGGTSNDSVSSFRVYRYADAPYFYHKADDPTRRPVTNSIHIPTDVPARNNLGALTGETVSGGVPDADLTFVSNRTHEFEKNVQRSRMRYVDPNYIGQFADKFKRLLNA